MKNCFARLGAGVGVWGLLCGAVAGAGPATTNATPPAAVKAADDGIDLFDGFSLKGWKVVDFAGAGPVKVLEKGVLEIGQGDMLTGLVYTNEPVRMNYEIALEGRRTAGADFFCGLTFPVNTNCCTLILGGWGGGLIGMSSIDGMDASENETGNWFNIENNRWYKIKLKVTPGKIEAWLDDRQFVNLETEGKRLGMRPGDIEQCMPLGLATWQTKGELRNIVLKKLK